MRTVRQNAARNMGKFSVSVLVYVTFLLLFRVGAFFFIVMNMVYANLDSIELLLKEKPVFV
jgi:hypothetical protein